MAIHTISRHTVQWEIFKCSYNWPKYLENKFRSFKFHMTFNQSSSLHCQGMFSTQEKKSWTHTKTNWHEKSDEGVLKLYYTECKPKNKKRGRPGNEATLTIGNAWWGSIVKWVGWTSNSRPITLQSGTWRAHTSAECKIGSYINKIFIFVSLACTSSQKRLMRHSERW